MVKKVLVTGFQPFLEFKANPSQRVAEILNGSTFGHISFVGAVLPVSYSDIENELVQNIRKTNPDLIIGTGLAAGRAKISLEKIAVNYKYSTSPDNDGQKASGEKIDQNMPDGIFSFLDVESLHKSLNEKNIPSQISLSAGAYICNYAMFVILREARKEGKLGGFVHLPADTALASSMKEKNFPSMSLECMVEAIKQISIQQLQA